jgi:hypothetical protein
MDDVSAEEIRAEFGMPPDAEPFLIGLPGRWLTVFSADWEGYDLELVGVKLDPEASKELRQRAETDNGGRGKRRTKLRDQNKNTSRLDMFFQPRDSPWPYLLTEWDASELSTEDLQRGLQPVEPVLGIPSSPPGGRNLLALQLWGVEVVHSDSNAYAQVRWYPALGRREAILGVENIGDVNDIIRIYRGLLLLRETTIRGRKLGNDDFGSKDRLLSILQHVMVQLHREGRAPTQENVAEALGIDDRTIRNAMKRYGLNWTKLKIETIALLGNDGEAQA